MFSSRISLRKILTRYQLNTLKKSAALTLKKKNLIHEKTYVNLSHNFEHVSLLLVFVQLSLS